MRFKRFIIFAASLMLLSSTAYAATNLMVANQTEYRSSAISKKKTSKDNSAVVNLTSGPILNRNTIVAYVDVVNSTGKTYRTEAKNFKYPTSEKLYYNPFDYNTFCGKSYRVYAKLMPYAYSTTVTVAGDFTP